jgi:anti-anti-sigma regulatory factor
MDVNTEEHGEVLIHRVSGRIDTGTAAEAERKLTAEVRLGRRVLLDLMQVTYVSSAGLRVVLFGLQPTVREVFAMSGFDKVVTIHDDQAAALVAVMP